KKKLKKKMSRCSAGIDDITYTKIMTIPNEALQGKMVHDPESYRLVGMECCLLLDERL
ncbi:hypothetical protein B0H19DRAFT_929173, partial [Mycena capillaripes]